MAKRTKRNRREIPDELIDQLLSSIDRPEELSGADGLMRELMGRLVERSLETELTEHLGYEQNEARPASNARNGSSRKTLLAEVGKVEVAIPRDREGSFEPQLIPRHHRRNSAFDERIIALYGRGMTVREIQGFFEEAYGANVSVGLISKVTEAVNEDVEAWRNRELDEVYPIVYLDGLVVKVRKNNVVQKRTVYIGLGVNMNGKKEVLGLWMSDNEGAKFWLHVMTELKNRGVQDILIACCDGLKGFLDAIEAVFPHTVVQTCIVHMIRNSLRLVAWGNRKAVAKSLRPIYQAATEEMALLALTAMGRQIPLDRTVMAEQLGGRVAVLPLRPRHPASDLHDERNRGVEPTTSQGAETARTLPFGRGRVEGHLPGLAARIEEVDHADQAVGLGTSAVRNSL